MKGSGIVDVGGDHSLPERPLTWAKPFSDERSEYNHGRADKDEESLSERWVYLTILYIKGPDLTSLLF
ncbi:hypothetical protein HI914_03536 [Erysiphe necator]|nr:hypothetical protein HI914_03536 [Erysiphe necator]